MPDVRHKICSSTTAYNICLLYTSKYIADVYVGIETGPHGTFSAVVLSGNEPDSMNNAVDQLEAVSYTHLAM